MKRFFCLFLCLCLFLPGCSGELMKNPVTFYYPGGNTSTARRTA